MIDRRHIIPMLAITVIGATSCNRVPSHVIKPDDMASLMADIHVAESVIELNRTSYYNDSLKQVLKQSVYEKHGVNQAQVDTSFDWYGHNISQYMDVYEQSIAILEGRIAETGNRIKAESISIAGDSVDIWNGTQYLTVSDKSPSQLITFGLPEDENMEPGDSYTWRAKFVNSNEGSKWTMAVNYKDKGIEYQSNSINGDGWREITFYTDSSRRVEHIAGLLQASPRNNTVMMIDSIMLIRNRFAPDRYGLRYRQSKLDVKSK